MCDKDRASGISCETCDTNLCNLFSRKVVTFENRVQIINSPSGTTIIKEEIPPQPIPTDSRPVNNNAGPFPGLNFPFFNMPTFGGFGFNNYGFPGFNQQGSSTSFLNNFFKPPFSFLPTSDYQPSYQPSQPSGNIPPYAPFVGFGGPFAAARPPYIQEQEAAPPVYAPAHETIQGQHEVVVKPLTIPPPRQENEMTTLQETVFQFAENNKPGATTISNEFTTTERPEKRPETTAKETSFETSTIKDEQLSTSKPPSLASSILQQFPSSNPSVEPNRNPSISDLVLNLASNNKKPTKKPLVQLPLDFSEATTDINQENTNEPIDTPVTIPEIIEDVATDTPVTTDLPINKDYVATLNITKKEENTTPVTSIVNIENDFISPTTKKTPVMSRATDDENDEIEEEDDDDNIIEPSLTEPENLRFNIRSNLKSNQEKQVQFPTVVESDNYYFEQRTQKPGALTFETLIQELPEMPVFGTI